MSQPLSLDQIDADIAEKLRARLASIPHHRWRAIRPLMLWGGAGGLLAGLSSTMLTAQQPESFLGMLVVVGLVIAAGVGWSGKAQKQVESRLTAADIHAVSQAAGLSRWESAYVDALASLCDTSPLLGESLTRDLLAQLNDLAANARALELHRAHLSAGLGPTTPLVDLEKERAGLVERLETAPDQLSRRAIEQSIVLCDGRLEQVRALAPGLASIEAQQEVVYQTLASVDSSLRRMRAVPAQPAALEVEEIRRATTEAISQARAVEEAVQEVLTIAAR